MASRFDQSALLGVPEAKAAFRAVEPVLRDHLNDATEETVRVIAFQAGQKVRRRFGILADHIQWSMSRATGVGKIGIGPREKITLPHGVGARTARHGGRLVSVLGTEQPTKIAHNVEFGHGGPHPAPAHAFMLPAAEGEKANYLTRVQQAGRAAEAQLEAKNYATGGGLL
jgi:hypothetical protein